jgi:hypothetical protein
MDYYIYKLFGYKTIIHLNNSAYKIQKCYKTYKTYQIQIRKNIIHRKYIYTISDYAIDLENMIENEYWNNMRNNIKNNIKNIDNNWIII